MEIYELNKQQQKAFAALKKAVRICDKLGIGFVNVYGSIYAYDSNLIKGMDDDKDSEVSCMEY